MEQRKYWRTFKIKEGLALIWKTYKVNLNNLSIQAEGYHTLYLYMGSEHFFVVNGFL